jgi:hypothetical protein
MKRKGEESRGEEKREEERERDTERESTREQIPSLGLEPLEYN